MRNLRLARTHPINHRRLREHLTHIFTQYLHNLPRALLCPNIHLCPKAMFNRTSNSSILQMLLASRNHKHIHILPRNLSKTPKQFLRLRLRLLKQISTAILLQTSLIRACRLVSQHQLINKFITHSHQVFLHKFLKHSNTIILRHLYPMRYHLFSKLRLRIDTQGRWNLKFPTYQLRESYHMIKAIHRHHALI